LKNKVLYFIKPCEIKVIEEEIQAPSSDEVLIKTYYSGISSGTEILFYHGLVPQGELVDENIKELKKCMEYPLKYGYSSVGEIIETGKNVSKELLGKMVFVFHPHESYYCVNQLDIIFIPDNISPEEAIFLPNMETAVNLVMDGKPVIGERVVVFGLGVVGLLTTALLAGFPLENIVTFDRCENRRKLSIELGAAYSFDPDNNKTESLNKILNKEKADLLYEISGNPEALDLALNYCGFESRLIVGSWYGTKKVNLNLGSVFHRNRIKIVSSQVSFISSDFCGRWDKKRRFEVAWKMIEKIRPKKLITKNFDITEASEAFKTLENNPNDVLQAIFTYS